MKWILILPSYGPNGTMWNHVSDASGVVKLFPSKRAAEAYRLNHCNVPKMLKSIKVRVVIDGPLPKNRWKERKP